MNSDTQGKIALPTDEPRVSRKTASVLFGDLVGFTPLSESRDVEDVRDLLSAYFQRCKTIIARYGGTVEKFIGDAVMAIWGVPILHEDDAERAVRAGMELTAGIATLGEELGMEALALRVGVVTGLVAVTEGAVGEGMVAGDAVNTAARIQALAAPGRVWVDAATRELAAAAVAFAEVGTREMKGKVRPQTLFEAVAVTAPVGGTRQPGGLTAPLTGRATELSALTDAFHATLETRRPRLVVVTGTAGVGKSRLGEELEFYLDGLSTSVWWHRGRCLAYGDRVAFSALTEAYRSRLNIPTDADVATVDDRLAAALLDYVNDVEQRRWLRPRLAALLGGSDPVTNIPREELFSAWTAFLGWLSATDREAPIALPTDPDEGRPRGGPATPVVLLVEDAQRADDGLLDFLEQALGRATFPLLVVLIGRPELMDRRPHLGSAEQSVSLRVEPLPDDDVRALLGHLVQELPEPTRELLVRRTEGLPLYAVETVRWLLDRDAVVVVNGARSATPLASTLLTADSAPRSIEALVAARVDELHPLQRRLLSDAAVIGSSFDIPGLVALGHDWKDAADTLSLLVRRGMLRPVPQNPKDRYTFAQNVTRGVTYKMLSRRDRRARHLAVAEYLAAREDPAGELVGPTAQHLLDAVGVAPDPGDSPVVDHAVDLLRVGARRALDLGAPSDALALIARGLGAAGNDGEARAALLHDLAAEAEIYRGNLESAGRHTRQAVVGHHSAAADLAAARTAARFAKALNQHGRNVEALHEIAQPWRDLAERRRTEPASDELDDTYLMVLLRLAGALVWQPPREGFEDLPAAEVAVLEAVTLAERGHDRGELAQALNTLSVHFWLAGAREMAELLIERAAAAARDSGRPADEMFMLLNLAEGLESRDLARFTGICERARQLGQLAPIQASIDGAAVMSAIACWLDGRWTDVPHFLEDNHRTQAWASVAGPAIGAMTAAAMGAMVRDTPSPESVDDPGLRVWLVVAQELGTTSPDADRMLEALRPALTTQGAAEDVWLLWPVAVDAALDTDNLIAADELVQLITVAPASGQTPLGHAQQLRLRGSLDLARGDITSAEDDLRRAVTALDDFGAPFYAARARLSLGRLLADSGRQTEAHAWLQEAGETFHRLGAEPSVQRLRELRVASSTT